MTSRRRDPVKALRDVELEQRLIRDVLLYGRDGLGRYDDSGISDGVWSHPIYRAIWRVASDLAADGVPVDSLTVSTRAGHPDLSLVALERIERGDTYGRLDERGVRLAGTRLAELAEARRLVSSLDGIRQQIVTHPAAAPEAIEHWRCTLDAEPGGQAPDWPDDVAIRQYRAEAEMLLAPYLPVVGFGALIGPPERGKTFLAIGWALTVAHRTGQPVLYYSPEGRGHYAARVEAWKIAHGVALDHVVGVHFMTESPTLDDPAVVARLLPHVRRLRPALQCVDTLARHWGGDNENDAAGMGRFVRGVETLARAAGGFGLVIHHTNATGLVERGSTALRGACDVMYTLTRPSEDDETLTLTCTKRKDGPPLAPGAVPDPGRRSLRGDRAGRAQCRRRRPVACGGRHPQGACRDVRPPGRHERRTRRRAETRDLVLLPWALGPAGTWPHREARPGVPSDHRRPHCGRGNSVPKRRANSRPFSRDSHESGCRVRQRFPRLFLRIPATSSEFPRRFPRSTGSDSHAPTGSYRTPRGRACGNSPSWECRTTSETERARA